MKISALMLKGFENVKGQAHGVYYDQDTDCACAMGCIIIGLGIPKVEIRIRLTNLEISSSTYSEIQLAANKYANAFGVNFVEDNDCNSLTIPQIAERLQSIGC